MGTGEYFVMTIVITIGISYGNMNYFLYFSVGVNFMQR